VSSELWGYSNSLLIGIAMLTGKKGQTYRWYALSVLAACICAIGLSAGTALATPGAKTGGARERSEPRELALQVVTDTPTWSSPSRGLPGCSLVYSCSLE
jgi:hypothetical protein